MPLKLYKMDLSPPACAVFMICDIHNIPVELIEVDLTAGEHLKPEFLKKNPMHTIPVLEDDDLIIQDSHAILTYLTDKYGKDDSLYPKDLKKRALVDQKLYFETLLSHRDRSVTNPAFFEGVREATERQLKDLDEVFGFLEAFLSNTKFVAGDNMTIADISLFASVSSTRIIIPIDANKYPKIAAWLKYMESQSFYKKCAEKGFIELGQVLQKLMDL